jgi:hypothetical protein
MHRSLPTIALATVALAAPAAATAAPPHLWISPARATAGDTIAIHGRAWPVIEFCSRKVRLSVLGVGIGTVRVRVDGRFTKRWVVPEAIGAGRRHVVARVRCESGKDGSIHYLTRSAGFTAR